MEGLGFGLTRVGPPCEHRGKRRPYFRDLNTDYENIAQRLPIVYDMFTKPAGYRLYSELCDERDNASLVASPKPLNSERVINDITTCELMFSRQRPLSETLVSSHRQEQENLAIHSSSSPVAAVSADCMRTPARAWESAAFA